MFWSPLKKAGSTGRPRSPISQQVRLDDYTLGDLQTEMNTDTLVVTYTIAMRGTLSPASRCPPTRCA